MAIIFSRDREEKCVKILQINLRFKALKSAMAAAGMRGTRVEHCCDIKVILMTASVMKESQTPKTSPSETRRLERFDGCCESKREESIKEEFGGRLSDERVNWQLMERETSLSVRNNVIIGVTRAGESRFMRRRRLLSDGVTKRLNAKLFIQHHHVMQRFKQVVERRVNITE